MHLYILSLGIQYFDARIFQKFKIFPRNENFPLSSKYFQKFNQRNFSFKEKSAYFIISCLHDIVSSLMIDHHVPREKIA